MVRYALKKQVTRGHNIVVDEWAGASILIHTQHPAQHPFQHRQI